MKIQKLPDALIDEIKAGEVVERPASIVKELVENSLDAAATRVRIELLDGGKKLIRITDNGSGMDREDLELALERHATSKITSFDDLEGIASFGFRGEALPSIAAVSEFSISSRTESAELVTRIERSRGVQSITEQAGQSGTEVLVKDLFARMPARLKFLKSTATEFAHICDYLEAMALAFPAVEIRLSHNGREVFSFPKANSSEERLKTVLGRAIVEEFSAVSFRRGSFELSGFFQRPRDVKGTPARFLTFLNGRLIKDRVIRAGILSGYGGLLMKGQLPGAVAFVACDPSWVDVNAHPAKTEVRFKDSAVFQDLITIGLQESLKELTQKSFAGIPSFSSSPERPAPKTDVYAPMPPLQPHVKPESRGSPASSVPEQKNDWRTGLNSDRVLARTPEANTRISANPATDRRAVQLANQPANQPAEQRTEPENADETCPSSALFESSPAGAFANARYLGQFKNCYLLFEVNQDLFVVDQHAFHERILFEELIFRIQHEPLARSALLVPQLMSLDSPNILLPIVAENAPVFDKLGFAVEILTDAGQIAVHSQPAALPQGRMAEVFEGILAQVIACAQIPSQSGFRLSAQLSARVASARGDLALLGTPFSDLRPEKIYHLFVATVACHSAVRSGDPLNDELVRRLIQRAGQVDFVAHCPHGRPVYRRFLLSDVEQWFAR